MHVITVILLAATVTFATMSPALGQGALGTNLIANGNAEAGPGGNGFTIVPAPGFSTVGNFTVVSYGAGGGFPGSAGSVFFGGGGFLSWMAIAAARVSSRAELSKVRPEASELT